MKIIKFLLSILKDISLKLLNEVKLFLAIGIMFIIFVAPMMILPTLALIKSNSSLLFTFIFVLEAILIDLVLGKKDSGMVRFVKDNKRKLKEKYESIK